MDRLFKMKAVFEKVPQRQWESFHCEEIIGPDYGTRWHFHPEFQLTLAIRSEGHRIVGDHISRLCDGDLILVGSNLPHVWHQDKANASSGSGVHAIVIRFLDTFLGNEFLGKPEMEGMRRLLRKSSRGLQITGKTRDSVAERVVNLVGSHGLARVLGLLDILSILSGSRDLRLLASSGYAPMLRSEDQDRMERVCNFIQAHLTEEISRVELSKVASLSAGAFSRFFRSRMGKTVPEYVNELRIGRACKHLSEQRLNITDIGLDCGFHNLANFNRRFREIVGTTPRDYRKKFATASGN